MPGKFPVQGPAFAALPEPAKNKKPRNRLRGLHFVKPIENYLIAENAPQAEGSTLDSNQPVIKVCD